VGQGSAADGENVEFVGQIGGATYAVAVVGDYDSPGTARGVAVTGSTAYLATGSDLEGQNALPAASHLEDAITTWAPDKVGPDRAFTLYLMDHGDYDQFYLDKPGGECVTPQHVDNWLRELESCAGRQGERHRGSMSFWQLHQSGSDGERAGPRRHRLHRRP
jgi:hypothetical protein